MAEKMAGHTVAQDRVGFPFKAMQRKDTEHLKSCGEGSKLGHCGREWWLEF